MAKIIGIGNALVDILVPNTQESLLADLHFGRGGMWHIDEGHYVALSRRIAPLHPVRATGGSSANTIHALSLMGDATAYIGTVADDDNGRFFARCLEERGIENRLTMSADGRTGVATTFVMDDGERTFATFLGVAPRIDTTRLGLERYDAGDILHVEGYLVQEYDNIEEIMRQAKAAGLRVSFDLASYNIVRAHRDFVRYLVREYVDIVFANEDEALAFAQTPDMDAVVNKLVATTDIAVVKVGKRGAHAAQGDLRAFAPARPDIVATDSTAAGDFFAAGFLHALNEGCPIIDCLRQGGHVAQQVIQVLGTRVDGLDLLAD
ncbi:MAG: adenosine kinase [Bacteroidaceae bacterium]|nr:adenosine kinase [Bacteroidaceae bacterium]